MLLFKKKKSQNFLPLLLSTDSMELLELWDLTIFLLFLNQAAAEKETDGVVCAFSKLISSVERCQAEMLEVNNLVYRSTNIKRILPRKMKKPAFVSNQFSHHQLMEMTLRTAEHRAQTLLNELKDDIAALQNRSTTLNQLAASEDYVLFLKVTMRDEQINTDVMDM